MGLEKFKIYCLKSKYSGRDKIKAVLSDKWRRRK